MQYFSYLGSLLKLDLGTSLATQGETVWEIIQAHFPATVELTVCGMIVATVVGVGIGSLAAARPNSALDAGGRLFGIITYAIPMYWFGMILQLIFAVQVAVVSHWHPLSADRDSAPWPDRLYLLDSLLTLDFGQFATTLYYLAPCPASPWEF
jgi:peptide/nickel transport system permease protein